MGSSRINELKQRASLGIRTGDLQDALDALQQLETAQPEVAIWPARLASVYRDLGRTDEANDAQLRSARCHVEAGEVPKAIAACKELLDQDADHPDARELLDLLYLGPGTAETPAPSRPPDVPAPADDEEAPLEELMLTEAIPGARPAAIEEDGAVGVHEIPIDNDSTGVLDLGIQESLQESVRSEVSGAALSSPQRLAQTPLFGSLDDATRTRLLEESRLVTLDEGETLFREGEAGRSLYLVVEGAVVPIAEGEPRTRLSVLGDGEFFGEVSILSNLPRSATIEAIVETKLLEIDRSLMRGLIRDHAEVLKVLLRFFRERLIDRQMRTSPFFIAFAKAERSRVARQFRFLEIARGATVVEQGQAPDGLFVLLCGELDVVDTDRDKVLSTLGPGDLFGGLALLHGSAPHAAVVARRKSWVLLMPEGRFRRIAEANPGLDLLIEDLAEERDGLDL